MKVLYYHTVDVRRVYDLWQRGEFPGHFLYGATHLQREGVEVKFHEPLLTTRRWLLTLHTAWAILTRRRDYDAVYATTFRGLEIVIFLRALGLFGRPIVVWHHQPVVTSASWLRERLARVFYRGMDHLLFFSQKLVDDSLGSPKARPGRLHVVDWGPDMAYYERLRRNDREAPQRAPVFISTGKELRDMPTLVKAFNQAGARLDIYICRSYNGMDYERLFSEMGTEPNVCVNFVEGMANGELARRVSRAACVVVCCQESNYTVGLTTVVEAMALGLPVICSRNKQMPMDIEREQAGLWVDYGDVEGWRKAVEHVAAHPEEARRMGENGFRLVCRQFNVERCARQVAAILTGREPDTDEQPVTVSSLSAPQPGSLEPPSPDTPIRQAQLRMMEMLRYVDEVCRREHIRYRLDSGNVLGAVRHGGFIPWDDDVDVAFAPAEYERFCRYVLAHPHPHFVLQSPQTDKGYLLPWNKLRDTRSEYVTSAEEGSLDYRAHQLQEMKGLHVDLFAFEDHALPVLQRLAGKWTCKTIFDIGLRSLWVARRVFWFNVHVLFPSFRLLGRLFGKADNVMYSYGTFFYKKYPKSVLVPYKPLTFEGETFPGPADPHEMCRIAYGDYMQLPPVEKRRWHAKDIIIRY